MAIIDSTRIIQGRGCQRNNWQRRKRLIIAIVVVSVSLFMESHLRRLHPIPYHNSALTGREWLQELLVGHPKRILEVLGMSSLTFRHLVVDLTRKGGLRSGRFIGRDEMTAIFLYMMRTNQPIRQVAERFQRSNDTVHRSFYRVLWAILSDDFRTFYLHMPDQNAVQHSIVNNPKFYPFFKDAIGAIDGTLIRAYPPEEEAARHRDRKGGITQNVLAACTFDMRFCYVLTGWEGSKPDSQLFDAARTSGLSVPEGKYLLGDGGFPGCDALLIPYRGVRYHLREWAAANLRDHKELFNLRHSQARNIIERIFGVAKLRWKALAHGTQFSIKAQAAVVFAISVIFNYVSTYEADTLLEDWEEHGDRYNGDNDTTAVADLPDNVGVGSISAGERRRATERRDVIAMAMWVQYQAELARRRGI